MRTRDVGGPGAPGEENNFGFAIPETGEFGKNESAVPRFSKTSTLSDFRYPQSKIAYGPVSAGVPSAVPIPPFAVAYTRAPNGNAWRMLLVSWPELFDTNFSVMSG